MFKILQFKSEMDRFSFHLQTGKSHETHSADRSFSAVMEEYSKGKPHIKLVGEILVLWF